MRGGGEYTSHGIEMCVSLVVTGCEVSVPAWTNIFVPSWNLSTGDQPASLLYHGLVMSCGTRIANLMDGFSLHLERRKEMTPAYM